MDATQLEMDLIEEAPDWIEALLAEQDEEAGDREGQRCRQAAVRDVSHRLQRLDEIVFDPRSGKGGHLSGFLSLMFHFLLPLDVADESVRNGKLSAR